MVVCLLKIPGVRVPTSFHVLPSLGISSHIRTFCKEMLGERRKEIMKNMHSLVVRDRETEQGGGQKAWKSGCELGFTTWCIQETEPAHPGELQQGKGGLK